MVSQGPTEVYHSLIKLYYCDNFQMDVDEIFMEIGELGKQQLIYLALLFLLELYVAFNVFKVINI